MHNSSGFSKPQLNATRAQMVETCFSDILLVGLAKADEELFVIRDDRFAITYHRELCGKVMTVSILEDVSGLGFKCKKVLLRVP